MFPLTLKIKKFFMNTDISHLWIFQTGHFEWYVIFWGTIWKFWFKVHFGPLCRDNFYIYILRFSNNRIRLGIVYKWILSIVISLVTGSKWELDFVITFILLCCVSAVQSSPIVYNSKWICRFIGPKLHHQITDWFFSKEHQLMIF